MVSTSAGRLPGSSSSGVRRPLLGGPVVHLVSTVDGWVIVEEWLPAGMLDAL